MDRFDIKEEQLSQHTLVAQEYLRVNAMFFILFFFFLSTSVNPTVWTLGHIPVHGQQVFAQYNKGFSFSQD